MTKEDKKLLLKDLCARLPYGVKVQDDMGRCCTLQIGNSYLIDLFYGNGDYIDVPIKPYLRPMSSMTEEEERIYNQLMTDIHYKSRVSTANRFISWLLENHFDYQELISKGLAIDKNTIIINKKY